MTRVLLLHSELIPHYRVAIYNALSRYLESYGFELIVASEGLQPDNPHPIQFDYQEVALGVRSIARIVRENAVEVVILFVNMRNLYLFPTYFVLKALKRRKLIYWGQGLNLAHPLGLKHWLYVLEHLFCDALMLYAEPLKKYVSPRFHKKVFIANNTLCIDYPGLPAERREAVLAEHGIGTKKNIICVGRLQKRKKLDHLVAAHAILNRPDIGLILVGPDTEGVLENVKGGNIYKLGPLYGTRKFDLLSAADVYCLPGAVGLSIVDAYCCGLPLVTEEGDESAEMMYLKDGENGFIVPRDDIPELANKLLLLLDNDALRKQFSAAAKQEIAINGHIGKMCAGFKDALFYVMGPSAETEPVPEPNSKAAVLK